MNRKITGLAAVVVVGLFACSASAFCPNCAQHKGTKVTTVGDKAGEPKAPCGGKAHDEKSEAAHKPCGTKEVTLTSAPAELGPEAQAVLATLPKIMYRVGDKTTCCAKSAGKIAEKTGEPIQYVIGEEVVTDEIEAKVKLASLLANEMEVMQTLQFTAGGKTMGCPVTAKKVAKDTKTNVAYRVGGFDIADKERAEKAVKLVADAADGVKMSYKVDGYSYCCDRMAGIKAKETGKPIIYVVGDEETPCKKSADLMFTQAKIRAIVATAAPLAM